MRQWSRLWAVIVIVIVAAGALVAACGSNDEGGGDADQRVTVPGVSSQINERLNALYQRGAEADTLKVTIYGPGTSNLQPLFDAFEKRFPGTEIKPVDQADSVSASKIAAEKSSGRRVADFYQGGTPPALTLSQKGFCEDIDVFTAELPKSAHLATGVMTYYYTPFGFVYNTDDVSEDEVPRGWNDLLDPRWRDQLLMYDPTVVGGTRFVFAEMQLPAARERYGVPYLEKLAAQNPTLVSAEPTVATDVAAGRKPIGIAVWRGFYNAVERRGGPVGFSFPLEDANLLVEAPMCRIKGGPAGPTNELFFNWLYTPEAQEVIAKELGGYSAAPNSVAPPGAPTREQLDVLPQIKGGGVDAYQKYFVEVDKVFKR